MVKVKTKTLRSGGECFGGYHRGRKMFRLLQPFLLLLLSEKFSYGYDLIKRLESLGIRDIHLDPGAVYRNLRQMQREGMVKSEWKIKSVGAPVRIYKITPNGVKMLIQWVNTIKRRHVLMRNFLKRTEKGTS